jgi:hypothetical protein
MAIPWETATICLVWMKESSLTTFPFFVFVLLLEAIVMFVFALLLVCLFGIPLFSATLFGVKITCTH